MASPQVQKEDEKSPSCPICKQPFVTSLQDVRNAIGQAMSQGTAATASWEFDVAFRLGCGHVMGAMCLYRWQQDYHFTCPYYTKDLRVPSKEAPEERWGIPCDLVEWWVEQGIEVWEDGRRKEYHFSMMARGSWTPGEKLRRERERARARELARLAEEMKALERRIIFNRAMTAAFGIAVFGVLVVGVTKEMVGTHDLLGMMVALWCAPFAMWIRSKLP
ncbi:uncharacterized protein BDZ99DRAFT_525134 [Mytilinidion resinicola]|uniref:RING-type domain-containing protein n=1 Tax=Mytilinidion resinicola TaxID=574789 RepID=A0A6A6Y845_9PEZI|nr:uncharacterized protein BDZ99DRAFT_525134 [Mytilinidion resinicola]KAF2804779.1 hypothetical protein BDZ99DRAFT_525134 [Mytilinidion resinicola]